MGSFDEEPDPVDPEFPDWLFPDDGFFDVVGFDIGLGIVAGVGFFDGVVFTGVGVLGASRGDGIVFGVGDLDGWLLM